mgnify:CR=1 FL=1
MNPMPNKDPTLWAALLAWLMDNWPAVYGALLALAIFRLPGAREAFAACNDALLAISAATQEGSARQRQDDTR